MAKKRSKAGRPKLSESDKLKAMLERAKPNIRVIERQDRFRHFHGDGSIGLEMTCAGRLMLVGAFDHLDATPEEAHNALLAYSHGYWGNYHGGHQVSDYQREVRGHGQNDNTEDRRGEWFEAIDQALRDCGHHTRRAVHEISVDCHWFPECDADWAARIINSAVLAKRELLRQLKRPVPDSLTICGELASDSDFAMLELARQGIEALTRRTMRRAA